MATPSKINLNNKPIYSLTKHNITKEDLLPLILQMFGEGYFIVECYQKVPFFLNKMQ